jgi:hypothetical protein
MPNWCYNRVHGSNKAIKLLLNDEGKVTFQKILPEPEALIALNSYKYEDQQEIFALIDLLFKGDDAGIKAIAAYPKNNGRTLDDIKKELISMYPLSQLDLCMQLIEKYGTCYWYDWRNKFWGCKWDASDDFGTYDGTEESIEFETPWSPPEGVIKEIARRYPDLEFVWHCDEESCAFSLDFIFNGDGTITEEDVFPEYYTPYIPEPDYLADAGILSMTKLSDVKECIRDNLGEASFDLNKETLPCNKCNITLTVYDWEANGGDELYSCTYENLEDDEDA